MSSVAIPGDVRTIGTPPTTKEVALESVVVDIKWSPLWVMALVNIHTVPLRCTKEVRYTGRERKETRTCKSVEHGFGRAAGTRSR